MDVFMTAFKDFGLAGLLAGSGTILLFLVVKWTLETTKEILKQAADERKIFNAMSIEWINALNAHTEQAKSFHLASSKPYGLPPKDLSRMKNAFLQHEPRGKLLRVKHQYRLNDPKNQSERHSAGGENQ